MILYTDQLSLINSRIRSALKESDVSNVFQASLQLCKGDKLKAKRLEKWFLEVSSSCKDHCSKLTTDKVFMRMWMLGNLDIKEVSIKGEPSFLLTESGLNRVNNNTNLNLLKYLSTELNEIAA